MARLSSPTLYALIGLPAPGKTSRARELEARTGALRLSPDEWMLPLFGEADLEDRRDVLEGRLIWLTRRALTGGCDVIVDFGLWARDERLALLWLARSLGARYEPVYVAAGLAELHQRHARRREAAESPLAVSAEDLEGFAELFEVPEDEELALSEAPSAPRDVLSWEEWIANRWPSAMD